MRAQVGAGSGAGEQRLVATRKGVLPFVVSHLVATPPPPEPRLQVFFDLAAELIKFNPPVLRMFEAALTSPPDGARRAALLRERIASHVVDASIFIQCVALTLSPDASPRRGRLAMAEIAVREGGGAGRGVGVGGGGAGASAEELRLSRVVARRAIVSALYEAQDGGDGDACEREGSDDEDEDEGVEAAETEAEAAETEAEPVACGGAGLVARAVSPQPGEMVLRLMGAITPEAVSVETICVINAALVHYHIAQAQGAAGRSCAGCGSAHWPLRRRRRWQRRRREGGKAAPTRKATTRPLRRGRMLMTMMRRAPRRRRPRYSSRLFDCWASGGQSTSPIAASGPFSSTRPACPSRGGEHWWPPSRRSSRRRRRGWWPPRRGCDARGMLRPGRRRLVANRATPPTHYLIDLQ